VKERQSNVANDTSARSP